LAVLFIIDGAFNLLAGITPLETALPQASGPILTELEALFIPLLVFSLANLNYMPGFHHFSI